MNSVEIQPCVSLPLNEEILKDLVQKAKDWALMHGISLRSKTNFNNDTIEFASFSLFPTVLKAEEFNKVIRVQVIFNELVHIIAHNREFLTKTLQNTILVDEFTRNLFNIYETVEAEGITQKFSLGLLRSDYMSHSKTSHSLKQVELNTIASSFAGIATSVSKLNRYVLQELDKHDKLHQLPENKALTGLCEGMLDAWKIYNNPKAIILFIVEDITINITDQRFHEFEIRRLNPLVKVIRRSLTEIHERASLSEDKKLFIDSFEIGLIYFRAGYEPGHYHSQNEWNARLMLERSKAIKCPTIQYHLAGTKKVQQELAKPGVLEKLLHDPKKIEAIRELFVGLYGLDFDEMGEQAIQMALDEPEKFVLKPQREGGGNNVYGANIKDAILNMRSSKERTAWILMERITPPTIKGYLIKPGEKNLPSLIELVSELGIYGVVMGDDKFLAVNRCVGHVLRTKKSTTDEGGIAAGYGALDCPILID